MLSISECIYWPKNYLFTVYIEHTNDHHNVRSNWFSCHCYPVVRDVPLSTDTRPVDVRPYIVSVAKHKPLSDPVARHTVLVADRIRLSDECVRWNLCRHHDDFDTEYRSDRLRHFGHSQLSTVRCWVESQKYCFVIYGHLAIRMAYRDVGCSCAACWILKILQCNVWSIDAN